MELIFLPMNLIMIFPPIAALIAVGFGYCWLSLLRGKWVARGPFGLKSVLAAALLWLCYFFYESFMYYWSRSVIAPIRVDLLLIAPLLYLISFFGAVACVSAARKGG